MRPPYYPEMAHIVLLGDSILDNQAYVEPHQATIDALRNRLPAGWEATLLARDGAEAVEVAAQLANVPSTGTHLVVSAGGNDALMQVTVLGERTKTVGDALLRLYHIAQDFEITYRTMLKQVIAHGLPAIVCTIYNGNFPERPVQQMTTAALAIFNDAIIRAAWAHRAPLLDLRTVCDRPTHYANEIEPSALGSARIAEGILSLIDVRPQCADASP
jgi:lysophospholipase L1-like esterase